MILTCPDCQTRYLLDRHILEPDGRLVRCSACGHTWRQLPDGSEEEQDGEADEADIREIREEERFEADEAARDPIPDAVIPGAEDYAKPDLEDENMLLPVLSGFAASVFLFLAFASALVVSRQGVVNGWPAASLLYATLGFEVRMPGDGLIFDRVKAATGQDSEGNEILSIEGRIINLTGEEIALPRVQATLLDQDAVPVESWSVMIEDKSVSPEQWISFETRHSAADGEQARVGFVFEGAE